MTGSQQATHARRLLIALFSFAMVLVPNRGASQVADNSVDPHVVALWLFDEPQYMNMTLTDAGANMTDLRLLPGGSLAPGRFGNALRISAVAGPAAALAQRPTRNDIGLVDSIAARVPEARPVSQPAKLLRALQSDQWTVECWLKLAQVPTHNATLFEIGHGTAPLFSCILEAGAKRFVLTADASSSLSLICPTDAAALANGQWHHVAFTRQGNPATIAHWIDGRRQATPQPMQLPDRKTAPDERPGLVGLVYADGEKQWPVGVCISGKPDFYQGIKTLFSAIDYSQIWRGRLRAPIDGEVEFSLQTDNPASLMIDGQKIIDATTSNSIKLGKASLRRDHDYDFTLEFRENGGDSAVLLCWRLPGKDWVPLPAGAIAHRQAELAAAWAEIRQFAHHLESLQTLPGWEYERVSWPRPAGSPPVQPNLKLIAAELANRFYLSLGGETLHACSLDGMLDELRISDVARYTEAFTPPASLSRNFGSTARKPTQPSGPPLLFDGKRKPGPIELGTRKYLFLDDAIIARRGQLRLRPNPPTAIEVTDLVNNKPWEHPTAGAFGDTSFYDHDGEIRLIYLNNAVWEEPDTTHTVCMAVSKDGLHFQKPELGVQEWNGSRANNILFKLPLQGRIFKDTRPGIPSDELFKCSGYVVDRGVYLFTSADGLHWRRNETILLPFDNGGGTEMFWDDQRGIYNCYLRHEGWVFFREPYGRAAALSQTKEPFKPWPFRALARPIPRYESWSLPSITEELPLPFTPYPQWSTKDSNFRIGQVYRTRAVKYEWGPDAYVAFDYRLFGSPIQAEESRKTELAVSRDGEHWQFYREPFYYNNNWEYEGKKVVECLAVDGLTRRGDELWQYIMVKFRSHAMWSNEDRIFRTRQRLDGFVSLDADERPGWMMTQPLIFRGNRLELNLASQGITRVALLDEFGDAIPGFSLGDCDPIQEDSVRRIVSWGGKTNVQALAGRPVRLRIEMQQAKLYAFQFLEN